MCCSFLKLLPQCLFQFLCLPQMLPAQLPPPQISLLRVKLNWKLNGEPGKRLREPVNRARKENLDSKVLQANPKESRVSCSQVTVYTHKLKINYHSRDPICLKFNCIVDLRWNNICPTEAVSCLLIFLGWVKIDFWLFCFVFSGEKAPRTHSSRQSWSFKETGKEVGKTTGQMDSML